VRSRPLPGDVRAQGQRCRGPARGGPFVPRALLAGLAISCTACGKTLDMAAHAVADDAMFGPVSDATLLTDAGIETDAPVESNAPDGFTCPPMLPCPPTPPESGAPCPGDAIGNVLCEYGDDPRLVNLYAQCNLGHWLCEGPCQLQEAGPPTALPVGCPPTLATAEADTSCQAIGLSCVYVGGECNCNPGTGGAGPSWRCTVPEAGCPVPRPRLGAACDRPMACDYLPIACNGGLSGHLVCACGQWRSLSPCPTPRP
jgi:hypothetical protein